MQLQPIVYVTNMERSLAWYAGLLNLTPAQTSDHWSTFDVAGTTLALHASDAVQGPGDVGLSLVVTEALEAAAERMQVDAIDEQPFGRSFVVVDPDGVQIQVNEHRD